MPGAFTDNAPMAVFRPTASVQTGGGHLIRSLVLADALAERGWRCAVAGDQATLKVVSTLEKNDHQLLPLGESPDSQALELQEFFPAGCDLLVIDDGALDQAYERACRPWATTVMAFDDEANKAHDCEIIVDQNAGRSPADYTGRAPHDCRVLTGGDYAMLRPQFSMARERALSARKCKFRPDSLVVTFGLTDPMNMTEIALKGIAATEVPMQVHIMLGSAALNVDSVRALCETLPCKTDLHIDEFDVAGLFANADLAIGAPGSSAWERCCLGLPTIMVIMADNQRSNADGMVHAGAAECLGRAETLKASDFTRILEELAAHPARLGAISRAAAGMCDGRGAERVLDTIESVCGRGSNGHK